MVQLQMDKSIDHVAAKLWSMYSINVDDKLAVAHSGTSLTQDAALIVQQRV